MENAGFPKKRTKGQYKKEVYWLMLMLMAGLGCYYLAPKRSKAKTRYSCGMFSPRSALTEITSAVLALKWVNALTEVELVEGCCWCPPSAQTEAFCIHCTSAAPVA